MPKVTRQPSGVVPGTADQSYRTVPDTSAGTPASSALGRRKATAQRAKKAVKRTAAKKAPGAKRKPAGAASRGRGSKRGGSRTRR